MFNSVNDDDDHMSDWMAGPGGVLAAIIALIIFGGLLCALIRDLF